MVIFSEKYLHTLLLSLGMFGFHFFFLLVRKKEFEVSVFLQASLSMMAHSSVVIIMIMRCGL